MQNFHCEQCGRLAFFENFECVQCASLLGLVPQTFALATFKADGDAWLRLGPAGGRYRQCYNYSTMQVCNGMLAVDDDNSLCRSCRFTELIPSLDKAENRSYWFRLELAKRRLLQALVRLNLPLVARLDDTQTGLSFRFAESMPNAQQASLRRLITGHNEGVITINLAEADDAERERIRSRLGEPYRTLLGHMRHESGHYYWMRLIEYSPLRDDFRHLFGSEEAPYARALEHYYRNGAPARWSDRFISAYCAAHPWEDWAETWAHYLHIEDAVDTARACGFALMPDVTTDPHLDSRLGTHRPSDFADMLRRWYAISYALNSLNRSLGLSDAYPFAYASRVIEKLSFIDRVVHEARARKSW